MYLTISKRFELSLSARQFRADRDEAYNRRHYGPWSQGPYGHGYNYVVHLVFHGPVDVKTGMMINVSAIKERAKKLLDNRLDHKFLNRDVPPFDLISPTAEHVAALILQEVTPLFEDQSAKPVICHVEDTLKSGATAFADGRVERHYWLEFSAARRTHSPHLSDAENVKLFGIANRESGHGHNYRLRVTLGGPPDSVSGVIAPYEDIDTALRALHDQLDHRNLNTDVPSLARLPITTESLARFVFGNLVRSLPIDRVRLHELPEFFAEHHASGQTLLGVSSSFHAAHRLHSDALTDAENIKVYAKCNNPEGHGHEYVVEATAGGRYDERSGTVFDFVALMDALRAGIAPWSFKHLNRETDDFASTPTTGENIVQKLWPRVNSGLNNQLHRLRLWETPNNRFSLRRQVV